jgi:hypothetical protein
MAEAPAERSIERARDSLVGNAGGRVQQGTQALSGFADSALTGFILETVERLTPYFPSQETNMKYLVVAVALVGLLPTAADARSPACKTEKGVRVDCKMKPPLKSRTRDGSGLTASDKEILDRAATRSLLESIDSQLRRQRYGY